MRKLCWVVVLACGCSSGDAPVEVGEDGPCSEIIDACLVDQMSCAVQDEQPQCVACGEGEYATRSGCQALGGDKLSHDFPDNTTPSGGELRGLCRSWTLGNDTELWVNAVEIVQDEASHHSNWTFVPNTVFDGPDGIWACSERDYSQLVAALEGGVLYAQSTQATHEVQKFPPGVAVRIPPHARIISDIHTLNISGEDVTGHMRLNVYSLEPSDVSVKLVPFHVTYDGLDIPPQSTSRFSGACDLDANWRAQTGRGFDPKIYYLLPHTHALGTRMFVETFGMEGGDVSLIDVRGFNGEARGQAYDPPLDLTGAKGVRFGCEFTNPRDESVGWGFDDQEMCEALGFADAEIVFESRIDEAHFDGDDGDIPTYTGDCSTLALPWDHDKPGGEPR